MKALKLKIFDEEKCLLGPILDSTKDELFSPNLKMNHDELKITKGKSSQDSHDEMFWPVK